MTSSKLDLIITITKIDNINSKIFITGKNYIANSYTIQNDKIEAKIADIKKQLFTRNVIVVNN